MIGIKIKLEDDSDNDVYEVISEPHVAVTQIHQEIRSRTFAMVKNLRTNKITQINVVQIDEAVSETQFKNWSQK